MQKDADSRVTYNICKKNELNMTNEDMRNEEDITRITNLVGYARSDIAGSAIRISINIDAFEDCESYTTSDGQSYVTLSISLSALEKVMNGERAVTTVVQTKN